LLASHQLIWTGNVATTTLCHKNLNEPSLIFVNNFVKALSAVPVLIFVIRSSVIDPNSFFSDLDPQISQIRIGFQFRIQILKLIF
jgi:hypothetical protein